MRFLIFFGLIKFVVISFLKKKIKIRSVSLGAFYNSSLGFFPSVYYFSVKKCYRLRVFNLLILRAEHECFVEGGYRRKLFC